MGEDTLAVKLKQTAFEIHAVLMNTGGHFEFHYNSGYMICGITRFRTTAILNELQT